ncbi:MAG: dipicolinate synthase subunit DpsA [Oscillospiraceae bacterium]|jgi:dipicolinate synthase subunit A|nr:dipicolinate synthase subunit DpsA [Oscillospiraceae bacterium]
MLNLGTFGILGGDRRQISLIEGLAQDGLNVYVTGFENANFSDSVTKASIEETIENSKYIVFPLPATKDSSTLYAPFSKNKIFLDDKIANNLSNKKIFCGISRSLTKTSKNFKKLQIFDYAKREEFAIRNAIPTAEGALEIAMREYLGTINGSRCLIAGFGRVGKALSMVLWGMRANVVVSARKPEDIAHIKSQNYTAILTSEIKKTTGYDIIFNTIPHVIFDAHTLAKCAQNSIIIDLASYPGGVDFEAASRLKIKSIHALSLPGKIAPKTAGAIIKSTIYDIINEEAINE